MSRPVKRQRVNHREAAACLRARPGEWLPVGEYRTSTTAASIARLIRTASGQFSGREYTPAGSFEARLETAEDGVMVVARYVGVGAGAV